MFDVTGAGDTVAAVLALGVAAVCPGRTRGCRERGRRHRVGKIGNRVAEPDTLVAPSKHRSLRGVHFTSGPRAISLIDRHRTESSAMEIDRHQQPTRVARPISLLREF